jgi:hypothetical protein
MATRIAGIALMERRSRNGIFYEAEELLKFHNKTVPLRVEHQGPESQIGEATFTYDAEKKQVKYEAIIDDEEWQRKLDNEQYQVSIGASVLEQRELCDEQKKKCLNSPILKDIIELSIVRTPGIPESTMDVIEHFQVVYEDEPQRSSFGGLIDSQRLLGEIVNAIQAQSPDLTQEDIQRKAMETVSKLEQAFMSMSQPQQAPQIPLEPPQTSDNTSFEPNLSNQTMTTEQTPKENVEEKVKVTIETDGEVEVAKQETKTPEATPEAPAKEVAKEDVSEKVADRIEKSNSETLKAVIETVKQGWEPKSQVAEKAESQGFVEEAFSDDEAQKFLDKVFENGYGKLTIDKEGYIAAHTVPGRTTANGYVEEAISTSGTISGVQQASNVSIQLGAKSAFPIRQYGQFQVVPQGKNTARFYRITVPDAGAITESPTTDITAATHTLTATDITCSVRGWRQVVEKSELEDYPGSFLNALRETARLEAIRDEHKLILEDLAGDDHDFGGVTTAPYHIGGSDGAATTNTTEEDTDGEFDEDGLSFAKRYLQELGQDTSPGKLIAFITPRAFETLSTASTLSEYAQIGNPSVTRLGELEKLYGIDIVVSNEVRTANNASRNLVCVKGKSWALASQRNMELELQKQIAGQYWDIVWTHRIGVDILDPNTYVIVSSVQA